MPAAKILRNPTDTVAATLALPTHSEHCLTVEANGARPIDRSLRGMGEADGAFVLGRMVFGGCQHYATFRDATRDADAPIVWLQGDACRNGDTLSIQTVALSRAQPRAVLLHGRRVGFTYEDDHARYCRLNGVLPDDTSASRTEQTRSMLENVKTALEGHGFEFTETVRTWLYLDRLLEWYDDFNSVRTRFFDEEGVFDRMVPASTGIGAGNPFGAAITAGVLAVQPKSGSVSIASVPSPLQGLPGW